MEILLKKFIIICLDLENLSWKLEDKKISMAEKHEFLMKQQIEQKDSKKRLKFLKNRTKEKIFLARKNEENLFWNK